MVKGAWLVKSRISGILRTVSATCIAGVVAITAGAATAGSHDPGFLSLGTKPGATRTVLAERYVPGIWVDPDGCEHWVMDDGWEGFMSPHTDRNGRPVCRRGEVCGVMNTDQLFATDRSAISRENQQRLANFFRSATAASFIITGHTDSRASDDYNLRLSLRRAQAVARVASAAGVRIVDIRGYGERQPRATNRTAAGMQQNRRVEVICLR
jgi:outer membrane protein OmpA-like peptidoglycan-associated protein